MATSKCAQCGEDFTPRTIRSTNCSNACSEKAKMLKRALKNGILCFVCGEPVGVTHKGLKNLTGQRRPKHQSCETPHGTDRRYKYGCRCDLCTEAQRIDIAAYEAKRRAAVEPHPPCVVCGEPLEYPPKEGGRYTHSRCQPDNSKSIDREVRKEVYKRDKGICQICSFAIIVNSKKWAASLDHIVPRCMAEVPDHSAKNLRLTHKWCNSRRGDGTKTTDEEIAEMVADMMQ